MSMIQKIGTSIGNGLAKATNYKAPTWLGEKFQKNPEGALAAATVTSIILKDGIGCAMYVTQSLNNKKIPEEKRKFVSALDLTNGVLMIGAQIAMFFAMRKYSGPIFNKLFKKSFNPVTKSDTISRMRMQDVLNGKNTSKKLPIGKDYDACQKDGVDLFKFVADIAAATIIGKRVIVPLIATPLAKKVEKRMNAETSAKTEDKPIEETPKLETGKKLDTISYGNTNLLSKYTK